MATIPVAQPYSNDSLNEVERAQMLARRYHAEFVDLKNFKIQHDLFKSVPVDIMFRYNFVPLEQTEGRLAIAVADPSKHRGKCLQSPRMDRAKESQFAPAEVAKGWSLNSVARNPY